jgi:hypothetical protein
MFLLLSSCSEDYNLNDSVFIEDVNNPGLPEYSEWGYNTFGAYIDRSTFVSNSTDLPAKIIVNNDTLSLRLKGTWKDSNLTLKISFVGYALADYPDLVSLNDSTIDLTTNKCIISMTTQDGTQLLKVFDGKINFKRVQKLYVDNVLTESIMSGTFNFKTFIDGEPIAVSAGRFDLGFDYDNFYKL